MRIKIPFIKSETECPIVRYSLGNGATSFALVDTGSEITLADEAFAKENKYCFQIDVTKNKVVMHGVCGSNEKPVINATTNIRFGTTEQDMDVSITAVLTNLTNIKTTNKQNGNVYHITLVLGSDFLTMNKAKLNFINSQLSLEQ